jgi:hypothetical protein
MAMMRKPRNVQTKVGRHYPMTVAIGIYRPGSSLHSSLAAEPSSRSENHNRHVKTMNSQSPYLGSSSGGAQSASPLAAEIPWTIRQAAHYLGVSPQTSLALLIAMINREAA